MKNEAVLSVMENGIKQIEEGIRPPMPLVLQASHWLNDDVDEQIFPVVEGFFDQGDKIAIISSSKAGKTTLCLQLAISLASGKDFLSKKIPASFVTLYVNAEVQPAHFKKRIKNALAENSFLNLLGENPSTVENCPEKLHIINSRGWESKNLFDYIKEQAKLIEAKVIILDPLYPFISGDENRNDDMKRLFFEIDQIIKETKAAIIFVHHDPKGTPGDKKDTDRGSGSGVLGRNYDSSLILTPHAKVRTALVASFVLRNYPPILPLTIEFNRSKFEVSDILPVREDSRSKVQNNISADDTKKLVTAGVHELKKRLENRETIATTILDPWYATHHAPSERAAKRIRQQLEEELIAGLHSLELGWEKSRTQILVSKANKQS